VRPYYIAAVLCLLVLGELFLLPSLLPFDFFAHQWVQEQRSCALDHLATAIEERTPEIAVLFALLTLGTLVYLRRWKEIFCVILIVVGGALICEWCKILLERPRPSVLPSVTWGNSFPSGHVMNTTILSGTLCFLCVRVTRYLWLRALNFLIFPLLAIIVTCQRLYDGHHWLTDVIGSYLLAIAWLTFTLARFPQVFTRKTFSIACFLFILSYSVFYLFPSTRIELPSVLSTREKPLVTVDFGEPVLRPFLKGHWSKERREPAGTLLWMLGEESAVNVVLPKRRDYILTLGARPAVQATGPSCYALEILVNQRLAKRIFLYEGWREYTILVAKELVKPGINEVAFRLPYAADGAVAFTYLKAFPCL